MEYEPGYSYDVESIQDYADEQYAKYFGDSAAYEDNLLIVFLTYEDYYDYYYIAWVGDHIATDINYMLGDNDTELGQTMASCINENNYKYSLDANLAAVMTSMAKQIQELGLESSYTCTESHTTVTARLVNDTDIPMTQATVEDALAYFADTTGIPVVVVVEEMEDISGSGQSVTTSSGSGTSVFTVLLIVAAIVVVVIVIFNLRKRKKGEEDFIQSEKNKEYRRFDDQY